MPENQVPVCNSTDNVCATDNAHQLAIPHDRDPLDFAFGQDHGNLANRGLFAHENDLSTHDISNAQTFSVHFANDVGFRDDANDPAGMVENRYATNTFSTQELCNFLHTCLWS